MKLGVLSDIHYAAAGERARGNDYEYRDLPNPLVRHLIKFHRRHLWLRHPLDHNHLLDAFIAANPDLDLVVANGDFSCDSAYTGLSDDASFESAQECLAKLRGAFGAKLKTVLGDHELGKFSLVGQRGGFRLESYRRATRELQLERFWSLRTAGYLLVGVCSSLLALPANLGELLPEEAPAWSALREEHLAEIRSEFGRLEPGERVLLFCHDPTALPFLLAEPMVRERIGLLERTIIGHLHSPLILKMSRVLSGMPEIRFLGHTPLRLSSALRKARDWKPFKVLLCPSLAGIELLKDGGYFTATLEAGTPGPARFHRYHLPRG